MKTREFHSKRTRSEYKIWAGMIQRCENPKNPAYQRYGGRGITICTEWRASFELFLSEMGDRPSALHSIDRKDGKLGYCKSNCRWATGEQQADNQEKTIHITIGKDTLNLSQWSRKTGIPIVTIHSRINKLGWSAEKAITTPSKGRHGGKLSKADVDQMRSLKAQGHDGKMLAKMFGVSHTAACRAISGRTHPDKAIAAA